MSVVSAEGLVKLDADSTRDIRKDFHIVWKHVLYLLLHIGKAHFNIVCYDASGREIGSISDPIEVSELESLQPYFSGTCRLKRLITWLFRLCLTIIGILVVVGLLIGVVLLLRWIRISRIKATEKRLARVRDLVADIVRMLQQQIRENEANPEQPLYIPVCVLRERLRQQNMDVAELWSDVVRYVYDVETCISVQEWRGIGETWQWQGGTGWQGSALSDQSQRTPFMTPPTECLKIRNMFSTDGMDQRGKQRIKRELLKRLTSCGSILHIGLDSVGNKVGA
ncbi:Inner nuclear membrane protein man1 [Fasciolopsis buskii]|uniref:Inner nuclear membrane protein man1 n=1 Tax=Fasciolopsis buskii TaxID=27845 RepID=A0A8E0RRF0_9TREM|nr:Inner nuclear membrane protein man1 [Fasciolopsis buski]